MKIFVVSEEFVMKDDEKAMWRTYGQTIERRGGNQGICMKDQLRVPTDLLIEAEGRSGSTV